MVSVMSPELGSTIVWFLSHWAKSYLLPVDTLYTDVSFLARGIENNVGVLSALINNPAMACVHD
jgi:hypothetical protein